MDSDNPKRFDPGTRVRSDVPGHESLTVRHTRQSSQGGLIVGFESITDRAAAESLNGTELFIDASERRPLDDGEYWPDDLIGLDVIVAGSVVGTIGRVELDTAQTRIEIRFPGGGSADVPFVAALVPVVDLDSGFVEVVDLKGLLTDY